MKARKPKMVKGMQFKSANVDEKPMKKGKGKKKGPSDIGMLQQRMPR